MLIKCIDNYRTIEATLWYLLMNVLILGEGKGIKFLNEQHSDFLLTTVLWERQQENITSAYW